MKLDETSILLIGPPGVGKSTQAHLLSGALERQRVSLDRVCWAYYSELAEVQGAEEEIKAEHGADSIECHDRHWLASRLWQRLSQDLGPAGAERFKEVMELHAVRRALDDHPASVFDFGAGHSIYSCEDLLARARSLLAGYSFVVLLLPWPDVEASMGVLSRNLERREHRVPLTRLRRYVVHPSNRALATHTVYTEDRGPREVLDVLLRLVSG